MNRRCIIAPTASKDLAKILDYFLAKSVDAGDGYQDLRSLFPKQV